MKDLTITTDFEGGNGIVREIKDNTVYFSVDLRDTNRDWFYWAICVQNAGGRTLRFQLDKEYVGIFGSAFSHDLLKWDWSLGERTDNAFVYKFAPDENEVYFAHNPLYGTAKFSDLAKNRNLYIEQFCISEKGNVVPWVRIGSGERKIFMTARHHCCEAPGTYALQGIIEELQAQPIKGYTVEIIPFVDVDGVINGDQGKDRVPHDHNRDYGPRPIYDVVASIMKYGRTYENEISHFFDFHSPLHQSNYVYFVKRVQDITKSHPSDDRLNALSDLLEKETNGKALRYIADIRHPVPPNSVTLTGSNFFSSLAGVKLATTIEIPYFGTIDNMCTQDSMVEFGRCFARTLKKLVANP